MALSSCRCCRLPLLIRPLDPITDLDAVQCMYTRAADYWILADRRPPDRQKAAEFFTDTPPGCDPAASHRLGLFQDGVLVGVAELSFGFPLPEDAYLGLMLLDSTQRNKGLGTEFLTQVQARAAPAPRLYLAVLQANSRGRAFWERHGFTDTGLCGHDAETGHTLHRMVKQL
jgi:GNAT superfamily N-acetyltransferase